MGNEEIEAKGISYSNIKFTLIEIWNWYHMFPRISRRFPANAKGVLFITDSIATYIFTT